MSNSSILLSTAYFPPIEYFSAIIATPKVLIEKYENFQKQSYRNRCQIFGANGKQTLSIPIKKGANKKCPIANIAIDYDEPWQKNHFKSIESAYRSSPFFEYYIDDLLFVFEEKSEMLFDLNHRILSTCIELLELDATIQTSSDFIPIDPDNTNDYRYTIHPKKQLASGLRPTNYYMQVFNDKHGFIPQLSILDLIFNEGPNARNLL